jgi:hypothetical protein
MYEGANKIPIITLRFKSIQQGRRQENSQLGKGKRFAKTLENRMGSVAAKAILTTNSNHPNFPKPPSAVHHQRTGGKKLAAQTATTRPKTIGERLSLGPVNSRLGPIPLERRLGPISVVDEVKPMRQPNNSVAAVKQRKSTVRSANSLVKPQHQQQRQSIKATGRVANGGSGKRLSVVGRAVKNNKKQPVLDKDSLDHSLDDYMMRHAKTAASKLDDDLDSYMAQRNA